MFVTPVCFRPTGSVRIGVLKSVIVVGCYVFDIILCLYTYLQYTYIYVIYVIYVIYTLYTYLNL